MYGAVVGARPVVILDGWPFAGPTEPRALHVFDVGSGTAVGRIEVGRWHAQGGMLEGHVTTANGREMFVAGLDDQAVRRWDLRSGERIGVDITPAARVTAIHS